MKYARWIAPLLVAWSAPCLLAQAAPEGTPERAIQDMALASKPEEIEKHLPLLLLEDVKTLAAEDRRAFEASLLWRQSMPGEQSELVVPEDGHAFLLAETSGAQNGDTHLFNVQLTDSVSTGADAVLRFAVTGAAPASLQLMIWMRFEEGEWRIRELDGGRFGPHIRFDDLEFVERFRDRQQKQNESEATSTLYNINYALRRYADLRPDVGFPDDLAQLAEPVAADTDTESDESAYPFLAADLAHSDFIRAGYHYRYQLIRGGPQGSFHITARPVDFRQSGHYAYFIDESGAIHQTGEDREATEDDPLMNSLDVRE